MHYLPLLRNFLCEEEAVNSTSTRTRVASRIGIKHELDHSRESTALEAAVFAHEFANELSILHSAVNVIEVELAESGAATQTANIALALQHARSGIARLDKLLGEFRSFTRARVNRKKADLARIIRDLLIDEEKNYAARGIRVEAKLSQGLPRVPLDGAKIRQALLNLCRNAADAMPAGGTLSLRAYSTRRNLHLAVADTGEGISPDVDVFEMFRTTKPNGTGIGLAVVRQIVSAHGGKISYASVPGKGTIFSIVLPLGRS
jgi:two-component system sensor histidine kinase HydH